MKGIVKDRSFLVCVFFALQVLEKLEEAAYCHALDNDLTLSEEEKWKIQELLTFIVVGGGPTGVELAGELTDFLYNEVANLYKNLKPYIRVHMFTYDLLNTFDQKLQDYALTHLRKKQNVQVHLGAFVQKVEPNVVHVKLGESAMSIRYGTLVWCAGIKPHPFVSDFGFAMNDKGSQILVDEFLKVKDESGIYAIGDCATIDNYWLPQTAQVANQQGQYLAKALSMDEAKIKPFEFHNKVSIFMGEVRRPFGASPNTCWLLQHLLDAIQRIFATHCFSSSFDGRSKVLIDGYGWSSTKVCQNHVPSIHRMIHSRISAMNFSFKKSCPYFLGPPTSSFENPGGRAPWHTWVA